MDALLHDVEDRPGALPLLSTALLELWQRRDGRRLRLSAYEATGGVRGAVARLAEDAFARLDAGEQALARRVLLRLATVEPEGGVERRRLAIADLDDGNGEVASVIDRLADGRLLTVSDGTVEFAHEALLREWPRLRDWIEEDRDNLRVHRSLTIRAQEWLSVGRDDGTLYRGAQLAEADSWAARADPAPSEAEHEFLTASLDRERRDRRARRRTLAIAFGALTIGVIAIAAVALVAIAQRHDADRQKAIATSRQLAAQAQSNIEVDPGTALSLALWALDTERTPQADAALRGATAAFRERAVMRADSSGAWAAQFSPDGKRLVTVGSDGNALIWDVDTGKTVERWASGSPMSAARYAPDGKSIALGFEDGSVVVTDAALGSRHEVAQIKNGFVSSVAFVGDGDRVAAGFDDGNVRVFTVGRPESPKMLTGNEGPVRSVDASADGTRVVSAGLDGTVRLWNLASGTSDVLHRGRSPMWDTAFSPDGKSILAVGQDGFVRRWNAADGTRGGTRVGRRLLAQDSRLQPRRWPICRRRRGWGRPRLGYRRRTARRDPAWPRAVGLRRQLRTDERRGRERLRRRHGAAMGCRTDAGLDRPRYRRVGRLRSHRTARTDQEPDRRAQRLGRRKRPARRASSWAGLPHNDGVLARCGRGAHRRPEHAGGAGVADLRGRHEARLPGPGRDGGEHCVLRFKGREDRVRRRSQPARRAGPEVGGRDHAARWPGWHQRRPVQPGRRAHSGRVRKLASARSGESTVRHVPSVCSKVISTGRTASNTAATGASSPAATTRRSGSGPPGMAELSS